MKNQQRQILPIVLTSILGFVILGGALAYSYKGGLFDAVLNEQNNYERNTNQNFVVTNNQKISNSNSQLIEISVPRISSFSPEANKASEEALKALRKLVSATDVGTTFQTYNSLVIEAKTQVDEAKRKLPQGELKKALESAIEAYADVVTIWNEKIAKRMDNLYSREPSHLYLIKKYKLQTKRVDYGSIVSDVGIVEQVDIDIARQMIWIEGKSQVEHISKLLESDK